MLHPCRNCDRPKGALRDGGLCYECWHRFEYGHEMDPGNRIGSGVAQMSIECQQTILDAHGKKTKPTDRA